MKKFFLILVIQFFVFCTRKEENQYPRLIAPKANKIIEVNSQHMLESTPVLLGLNFIKDTTVIFHKQRYNNSSIVDLGKDTLLPKYDLKIIIDTSYNFHYNEFEYEWVDLHKTVDSLLKLNLEFRILDELLGKVHYGKINILRKQHVKSYPLLIYNNETKKSYLHKSFNGIQLIQEAKDSDGKWKPIEYLNNLNSSFISYDYYELKAKNYLATSIIRYHGNFKTKIRVKIRLNNHYYYSNEIEGFINQSQFNDDFLNLDFYKIFDPYLEDKWFLVKKNNSLLKSDL
jgi:hypothetical protein